MLNSHARALRKNLGVAFKNKLKSLKTSTLKTIKFLIDVRTPFWWSGSDILASKISQKSIKNDSGAPKTIQSALNAFENTSETLQTGLQNRPKVPKTHQKGLQNGVQTLSRRVQIDHGQRERDHMKTLNWLLQWKNWMNSMNLVSYMNWINELSYTSGLKWSNCKNSLTGAKQILENNDDAYDSRCHDA